MSSIIIIIANLSLFLPIRVLVGERLKDHHAEMRNDSSSSKSWTAADRHGSLLVLQQQC
jgi:hypothetical protein